MSREALKGEERGKEREKNDTIDDLIRSCLQLPPPPDFDKYIFAGIREVAEKDLSNPEAMQRLEQLLLAPHLGLCFALFEVSLANDADVLCRHLVHVFEHHNQTLPLLTTCISREVQIARNSNTLFRSNRSVFVSWSSTELSL